MGDVNGFLPVYTSREFDPRWFCVWEIFVLVSWGASGGDVWILDSQSLFVLIRHHNLEVSLWIDHRLCLFEIILSLNNNNLTKSQNLHLFGWYVQAVGAEGGAVYHYPENNSDWEQRWGETGLKASHGNSPENQAELLEVSLWLSIPSHLAASPAHPSPQDPPVFSKEGRMIQQPLPPPRLKALQKALPRAQITDCGWDQMSSHLYLCICRLWALEPALPCATVRQILISSQGWEEWQENAACQHWLDWLVKSR